MVTKRYLILWPTKLLCRLFLRPFFKISIHGIENIPEKTGFILSPSQNMSSLTIFYRAGFFALSVEFH